MTRARIRRIVVSLVALALIIGVPVYGPQSLNSIQLSAAVASADGVVCNDCDCCEGEGMIDTATCLTACTGMVATLIDPSSLHNLTPAASFAELASPRAGFSIAPDPSPPKLSIPT